MLSGKRYPLALRRPMTNKPVNNLQIAALKCADNGLLRTIIQIQPDMCGGSGFLDSGIS